MKRRSPSRYSPEPKRTLLTDAGMNNNNKSNEENYVHGLDFNLNARPAEDDSFESSNQATPVNPIHFTPSSPTRFIVPTDYRPSQSIEPTEPVVQPQMFNFGVRVDGWTGQVFHPSEFYQSTFGGFDATMVNNTALPVVFLSTSPPTMQVQNLFAEAPPGEITISGHSAVEPQPLVTAFGAEEEALTALRLGLHHPECEIQMPETESGQNNQINAVADVAEASVKESKIAEAADETEETNENNEEEAKEKEATFTCAVCWCPLKEETSTICGHIFCSECIRTAIKAQKKCPTCRRKLTRRNIHRVYLPTSD